jgi:hypothetical protein
MHVSSWIIVHYKFLLSSMRIVRGLFPEQLRSLKAVEYVGREPAATYIPIKSVILEVHVYRMCSSLGYLEDDGTLLQTEVIQLPSLRFEGIWEGFVIQPGI